MVLDVNLKRSQANNEIEKRVLDISVYIQNAWQKIHEEKLFDVYIRLLA
jgi:hypothetical protein